LDTAPEQSAFLDIKTLWTPSKVGYEAEEKIQMAWPEKQSLKAKQKLYKENKQKYPWRICTSWLYYLTRQKESGMLNTRFTNFQHCFHHFQSVMLAAIKL
jgi:hypothetical protein